MIQYFIGDFRLSAISLRQISFRRIEELAERLAPESEHSIIVASSDFTHYGPDYGYDIFSGELDTIFEKTKQMDMETVSLIMDGRPEEFYDRAKDMSICGWIPITVLMVVAKRLGWSARLIGFDSSFRKIRQRNFVNYVALAFLQE